MNESSPVWVAHRGQARDHPENTLAAIQAALECGAQYIEVDVQCSKDGELYLMHDALLSRTVGIPDSLLEMTSEQIEALSAYEPDRLGATFRGESIPKLSDLAELISGWPGTRLFVEIKQESILARGVDDLLQRLTVVMEKVRRQCIVISFSLPFIHAVKDQGVFDTGWIIQDYDDV